MKKVTFWYSISFPWKFAQGVPWFARLGLALIFFPLMLCFWFYDNFLG